MTDQRDGVVPTGSDDDPEAMSLVRQCFAAFDARDYAAFQVFFTPDATLVHHNGVLTTVAELLEIIRTAQRWPPRRRELSDFRVRWVDRVAVVGCRNQVTVPAPDGRSTTDSYNETWVVQRNGDGLRVLHVHYSRVTATTHTEGA